MRTPPRESLDATTYLALYQLSLMEQASEAYWCAGWMTGLEDMMWDGSLAHTPEAQACRNIAQNYTGIWWTNNKHWSKPSDPWRTCWWLDDWLTTRGLPAAEAWDKTPSKETP